MFLAGPLVPGGRADSGRQLNLLPQTTSKKDAEGDREAKEKEAPSPWKSSQVFFLLLPLLPLHLLIMPLLGFL